MTISVGQACRQIGFPGPAFWRDLGRLNYFILMPAFLVRTIALAELKGVPLLPYVGALLCSLATMMLLIQVLRPALKLSGPQYTSFFQAATRWNGFVALAVIATLYGTTGMGPAGIVFAVYVPTVNAITVILLTRHRPQGPPNLPQLLWVLARNPLILACLLGATLKATGVGLSGLAGDFTRILAEPAVALGLLSVGAGLNPASLRRNRSHLALAAVLKLVGMPMLIFVSMKLFGISGMPFKVAIIAGTVPTAAAGYILAGELGGDADFMASLITATTVGAIFTMPIAIALLNSW